MEEVDIEKSLWSHKGKGTSKNREDGTISSSLFSSTGYNPSLGIYENWSPTDGPRQVWVNIEIENLDRIDTVNQSFGSEFTVTQSWLWSREDKKRNKSLVLPCGKEEEDNDGFINSIIGVKTSWEPKKLKFLNAVKGDLGIEEDELVLKKYNQLVLWEKRTHVSGIFSEKFELASFPFDCQDFHIEIAWQDLESVVNVYPNPIRRDFLCLNLNTMVQREYRIHEPIVEVYLKPVKVVSKDLNSVDDHQKVIQIDLKGERYWRSYFWQIILMMGLMSTFSLFVFTLDVKDAGDRLGAGTTIFLTLIAFQFSITTFLPRLTYLTLLDKYITGCMFYNCSVILQISVIAWLRTHAKLEVTNECDTQLLIINFVILVLANLGFVIYSSQIIIPQEMSKLVSLNMKQNQATQMANFIQESLKNCMKSGDSQLTKRSDYKVKECRIESWFTIQAESDWNSRFLYCGKAAMERIIHDLYQAKLQNRHLLNQDMLSDHLRNHLTGLWNIELKEGKVKCLSAWMIVKLWDYKIPKILFTKITGDQNLPAGKVSIQMDGIPLPGDGNSWPGKVLIRKDKQDPKGFKWIDVNIQRPSSNKITTILKSENAKNNATDAQNIQVELTHLYFPESHIAHFNVNPLSTSG